MEDKKKKTLKDQIKELKKTPKGVAILKLIRWTIFFIALFLFILIASLIADNSPQKEPQDSTIINNLEDNKIEENIETAILTIEQSAELINKLKNNFSYKIDIKINNNIYLFDGDKNLERDTGYKETSEGIVKYIIDNTGTYRENLIGREPITNLYEGLNEEYMNWDKLFELMHMEYSLTENNVYHMANVDTNFYLTIENNNIKSFKIEKMPNEENNGYQYEFIFKVGA